MEFDHVRLRMYRERSGLKSSAVGPLIGIHRTNYERIENGTLKNPSFKTLTKVVNLLRIPIDAIHPNLGPYWIDGYWYKTPSIETFLRHAQHASQCITVHHGVDAYLLDGEMARFQARKVNLETGMNPKSDKPFLKWSETYWTKQAKGIGPNCVHLIVGPENFFTDSMKAEWIHKTRTLLGLSDFGERSALVLLKRAPFLRLEKSLNHKLPFPGWSKVSILDDDIVMIRSDESFRFSYHPPTAREIRDLVLREVGSVAPTHCPGKWLKGSEIEGCNRVTAATLSDLEKLAVKPPKTRGRRK